MEVRRALCVIVKDLCIDSEASWVVLPLASSVNQTKIEFLQVRNLLACSLNQMTRLIATMTKLMLVFFYRIRFGP